MSAAPNGHCFRPAASGTLEVLGNPFTRLLRASSLLLPLACAAVALPAFAAHRAPTHAISHAHAAAPSRASTTSRGSRSESRASAHPASTRISSSHGSAHGSRHAAAEQDDTPAPRGRHARGVAAEVAERSPSRSSNRPLTRRERAAAEADERAALHAEALAALQSRASKYGRNRIGGKGTRIEKAALAREEARLNSVKGRTSAPRDQDDEVAADRHTENRVHAWYSSRRSHPDVARTDGDDDAPATGRDTAKTTKLGASPVLAAKMTRPDLSPAPQKATAADFTKAAEAQRSTIAAAHAQQVRQTTEADDTADAESHIPSTAPTEREASPFVHGSFDSTGVPVSRAQRPAPSTHAPVAAIAPSIVASTPGVNFAPPLHVDLKHRGDGLNSAIQAETAAADQSATGTGKLRTPQLAADNSPHDIRAIADATAKSPTPKLKLPAPPAAALHRDQPAAAAVNGTKKLQLDPTVAQGMTEETFDDDSAPATARTAVALVNAGPAAARTKIAAPADMDADTLTSAALVSPNLFDREGHLILVAPMKGSHEILVHQNQMAISDGLNRIQDDRDLLSLRQNKLLVTLPDEDSTYPDDRLPANRRYARPWTVRFLRDLARAHYARFGTPLIVTSAARTVEFQRHLVRVNGNAAPPTGDIASPHLYGQAIDIGKRSMGITELTWMRAYLTPVENDGKIDVEEEFQQSCFHISVYRRYLGLPAPRSAPAQQLQVPMLTAKEAPAPEPQKQEKHRRRISTAILATGLR